MTRVALPDLDAPEPAVSTHELRRFLAGELAPERRAHIESALTTDPALRTRADALAAEVRAEEAAFRLEVPLPRFLDEQERRAGGTRGLFARIAALRITLGAGALVATAAAVLLVVRPGGEEDVAYDGLKGAARVGFFVKDADGVRPGTDGERLTRGDQIQFAVKDDDAHQAMVLVGVDGRGAVTVYAAETVTTQAKGPRADGAQARPRLLPDSLVLDDATGAERFFVVYGDPPVDALRAEVERAAQQLASARAPLEKTERLPLPSGRTQSSVHIVKVPSG